MKKITTASYIFIAVLFQIAILLSIIGKYEYIRATGTIAYIEASGYDPTDLFRGDYVNLRYLLPVPQKYNSFVENNRNKTYYIVPTIESSIITGIAELSTTKPSSDIFLKVQNAWTQQTQKMTIKTQAGIVLPYTHTWCESNNFTQGGKILFDDSNGSISHIQSYDLNTLEGGYMKEGTIQNIESCQNTLSIATDQTNKYYVPDKKGGALEQKIRTGGMYAQWKIGKNGFIMFEDIVEKKDIK